jgi:hypothetical protein
VRNEPTVCRHGTQCHPTKTVGYWAAGRASVGPCCGSLGLVHGQNTDQIPDEPSFLTRPHPCHPPLVPKLTVSRGCGENSSKTLTSVSTCVNVQ